ncbi:MAG: hypothetical protein D5S00_06485 [Tindallia sp. MSAO_Bac2]|nr:MAG: hypothetical protein D5S00_06485 [Tindallia sp. MSAO_Bac2]
MKSFFMKTGFTDYVIEWLSKVAPGVYYVSPDRLGVCRYKKDEVRHFPRNPQFLRQKIHTVSEVIMYVRASFFRPQMGDIRVYQPPLTWHYNLGGEEAILANNGNCGALSSLFNYLLKEKYDEVGFIAYSDDEGGHVFNYIKQNDRYYFIDLLNYLYGSKAMEHRATMIYEAASLDHYSAYYRQRSKKNIKLLAAYEAEEVLPMGRKSNEPIMYFPEDHKVNVLYETPESGIVARFYKECNEYHCREKMYTENLKAFK